MNEAKALIVNAKLKIIPIDGMAEAAEAAVKVADLCRIAKELNLDIELSIKSGTSDEKGETC